MLPGRTWLPYQVLPRSASAGGMFTGTRQAPAWLAPRVGNCRLERAISFEVALFISIPPKYSVSSIMGYLKGKSALMIFDKHANLKYKPHPGVNKQQSTSHRERTVIWGLYYEILANQIQRMQMSFRFRCKGVVRNTVSHEVYYELFSHCSNDALKFSNEFPCFIIRQLY